MLDGGHAVEVTTLPGAYLDYRPKLDSVGLVCICGKSLVSMEGVARKCECGRVWIVTAMLLR